MEKQARVDGLAAVYLSCPYCQEGLTQDGSLMIVLDDVLPGELLTCGACEKQSRVPELAVVRRRAHR